LRLRQQIRISAQSQDQPRTPTEEVVAEALPTDLRAISALQGPRERATTWTTCRSTRRSTRRAANLKKQIA